MTDRTVLSDAAGNFSFPLIGYSGNLTINARAVEWSPAYSSELIGDWATASLSVPEVDYPEISQIDVSTGNSRLAFSGQVSLNSPGFSFDAIFVQLDYDGDPNTEDEDPDIDAQFDLASDGSFNYSPPRISADAPQSAGMFRARTVIYVPSGELNEYTELFGDWTTVTAQMPGDLTPFGLYSLNVSDGAGVPVFDTNLTSVSITGTIQGIIYGSKHEVQFDHAEDGTTDGTALVEEDGTFIYRPQGLNYGAHELRLRTSVWDPVYDREVLSDWTAEYNLAFTLTPPARASVEGFAPLSIIGNPDPSPTTNYAAFVGQVAGAGAGHLIVQLDHDAHESVDGSVLAEATGAFQYRPLGLSNGTQTIAARTAQYDPVLEEMAYGEWTELEFTLDAFTNAAPTIVALVLLSDTDVPDDQETASPAVTGTVNNESIVSNLLVEFDYEDDDVVDGTTLSIDAENSAHRSRIQEAWDVYQSAARELAITYNNAAAEARQVIDAEVEAANQSYTEAYDEAFAKYQAAINVEDLPHEQYRAATIEFNRTTFEAGQARSQTIADAPRSAHLNCQYVFGTKNVQS